MNPRETDDFGNPGADTALWAALDNVMLLPGQDVPNSEDTLVAGDPVADIDQAIPEFRILIKTARDSLPGRNFNQSGIENELQLAGMRVRITADLFQAKDIYSDLISNKGLGKSIPCVPNDAARGRAGNHRVDMKLVTVDRAQGKRERVCTKNYCI